jgi:hypothetical protein
MKACFTFVCRCWLHHFTGFLESSKMDDQPFGQTLHLKLFVIGRAVGAAAEKQNKILGPTTSFSGTYPCNVGRKRNKNLFVAFVCMYVCTYT